MKEVADDYFRHIKGVNEHAVFFGALSMLFHHFLVTTPNPDLRVRHGLIDGFSEVLHRELNQPSDTPRLN